MRAMRKLLQGKACWAPVALVVLCPVLSSPTASHAQLQKCFATNISEQIMNQFYTSTMGVPPYTFHYDVKVDWDCTVGMVSACTVCELDVLYRWDPATNDYTTFVGAVQTQDFIATCTRPNTSTWSASFSGLAADNYKLVVTYKNTNGNSCSDPTNFRHGADIEFTIP